jgi:urea carboxylase-associated protein 2
MPEPATSTLDGARAHARSQADAAAPAGRSIPSSSATDLPAGVESSAVVWDETIEIGGYASRLLRQGTLARITDLEGDGCAQLLVYNAASPNERLNVADTVKVQWQAYLNEGALLLSDMGRVLATIVADTSARHDCLCGCSNRRTNEARFGEGGVASPSPNARDLLALAAAKNGLGRADIAPNINLFKGVRVVDDGSLRFEGGAAPAAYVELRVEMDVIVLIANTPHPLDPRADYSGTPVRVTAWRVPPTSNADDPFRTTTPERRRAFENTDEFLMVADQ